MIPVIKKAEVKKLLESGVTKEEVKNKLYPELTDAAWKNALKAMGLSSYKVKVPKFIIDESEPETVVPYGSENNSNITLGETIMQ